MGRYDAIVLAQAGLFRLDMADRITERARFRNDAAGPWPGRAGRSGGNRISRSGSLRGPQSCPDGSGGNGRALIFAGVGRGCSLPVAAFAEWSQDAISIKGRVTQVDGLSQVDVAVAEPCPDAESAIEIGKRLAALAIEHGADVLLGAIR